MVQNGPISTLWWILALPSTQENLCIFGCFGVKCNEDEKNDYLFYLKKFF